MHSRRGTQGAGDGDSGDGDASTSERAAALHGDLQRIGAKTAAYAKERLDALALLQQPAPAGSDPEGRDQAARALVAQLDVQLERLELVRRRKQAELGRLGQARGEGGAAAAASVTLDDIIANEGVRG